MTRFNKHQDLDSSHGDLCLPRTQLVVEILDALGGNAAVRLLGPDNCGKSTLLNLVSGEGRARGKLHFQSLPLLFRGTIEDPKKLVDRGLKLIGHWGKRKHGIEPPAEGFATFRQAGRWLSKATGKRLCVLIDNLYRFQGDWNRFPVVGELLEELRQDCDEVRWVVTDNGADAEIERAVGKKAATIEVHSFSIGECVDFLRKNFPDLGAEKTEAENVARIVYDETGGYPYLLMRFADRLSELPYRGLPSAVAAVARVAQEPDKTVEKVLDYKDWDPDVEELLQGLRNDEKLITVGDRQKAAGRLLSTGFFSAKTQGGPLKLAPANPLFRRKAAQILGFKLRTPDEQRIFEAPIAELPKVLSHMRRKRHSHGLLIRFAMMRVAREPEKGRIKAFLACLRPLFDLGRTALFIVPEQELKRIVLVEVSGEESGALRRRRDDLGWAEGDDKNHWLYDVLESSRPVRFEPPLTDPVTATVRGAKLDLELDQAWREIVLAENALIALPFLPRQRQRRAILMVESRRETLDFALLRRLDRVCRDIAEALWSSWEFLYLIERKRHFVEATRLMSAYARAGNATQQLQTLADELQTFLQADYVDLCEVRHGSRFRRLVRSMAKGFEAPPYSAEFDSDFRSAALRIEGGSRLTSNRPEWAPIVPDVPPKRFGTSISRRCGGGVRITPELIRSLSETDLPEALVQRLRRDQSLVFVTDQKLRKLLDATAASPDEKTKARKHIFEHAETGVGVLSVAFDNRRILSFADLQLIDAAAELATPAISAMRAHHDLAMLHRDVSRALSHLETEPALRRVAALLAKHCGVDHCAVSLVRDDRSVVVVAAVGYRQEYEGVIYPHGHGRLGYIIEEGCILRHDLSTGEELERAALVNVAPLEVRAIEPMELLTYVDRSRKIFTTDEPEAERYVGIPIIHRDENGKVETIGCIELLQLPGEPELTLAGISDCAEVAGVAAPFLSLMRERRQRELQREAMQRQRLRSEALEHEREIYKDLRHDLNSPLTSIAKNIYSMHRAIDPVPASIRHQLIAGLDGIEASSQQLQRISNFTRAAQAIVPDRRPIQLGPWLRDYAVRVQQSEHFPDIEELADDQEVTILFDPGDLERVLDNLIKNAEEAQARMITAEARRQGSWVEILVRDDGVGFDEDNKHEIWSPRYSTKDGSMVGRGLAIVKRRVEANAAETIPPRRRDGITTIGLMTRAEETNDAR